MKRFLISHSIRRVPARPGARAKTPGCPEAKAPGHSGAKVSARPGVKTLFAALFLASGLALVSCDDALVDSETYGSLEGVVRDDSTTAPIAMAAVTTNPATEAIVTDSDGKFSLKEIPTGSYSISVKKSGYERTSVSVAVRENRTTHATILVPQEKEEEDPEASATVNITNWWNETSGDSVHVHVGYRIENTGSVNISEYDITFRIENPGGEFFHNEEGSDLQAGRSKTGEFEKYIRNEEAGQVEVDNLWYSREE